MIARATTRVGRYQPNAFGLHDLMGNVAEFTADCWNDNHVGAPADGSTRTHGDCISRVARGLSYLEAPQLAHVTSRRDRGGYHNGQGFRVARDLP